ncbi:MAG: GerMN domain-containing protein [Brevinematales bacterium]|nr:GerMN domain-containing protein [Brevinematales bacterium]
MAKRKRKKSKLVPILWIITLILFGLYFIYNNFNLKKFLPGQNGQKTSNHSKSTKTLSSSFPFLEASKSSSSLSSYQASIVKVKLYVGKMSEKFVSLVPIEKEIQKSQTPLKDTINALIDFRDENYLNLIPLNTKINKIWIKDNFVHIDLSEEFNYNSFGVAGYNIQIYQIVYTATQFENLKGVYFYINGKMIKYLGGEGFLINNPVKPYTSLPKFSF